ncbi:hypothetical protein [Xanthomonas sp. NCPPB 2632]|uniref:hypothetical protein n=1 Tax=Xanthomonas sp. NCPPB 2632 TaxID=3240912 RepID=UPI0035174027
MSSKTINPFYSFYRPVRNRSRRYNLFPSLTAIWAYSLHIIDGQPLSWQWAQGAPPGISLKKVMFPFQLVTLAREIIINAATDESGDKDLADWRGLADLANEIRRAENNFAQCGTLDVLWELHSMAHLQFPLQRTINFGAIVRASKIFGTPGVEAVVVASLGMTMRQLLRLGFAVFANYRLRPTMNALADYTIIGASAEVSRKFFDRMAIDAFDLRKRMQPRQSYDANWIYTLNDLTATPLIRVDPAHPERLVCPIPRLLFDRITNGVFFDIVNEPGFSDAFGPAFESYTGEALRRALTGPEFRIEKGKPYQHVKRELKHGADWVVSDPTGHIFVECKAKRFAYPAKMLLIEDALERDLQTFAKAIVQNYKNILDAKEGITDWSDDGLPVYPLVVTLEELYLFGPAVTARLDAHVEAVMVSEKVPLDLLRTMPWLIASVRELELAAQVVNKRGVSEVFGPVRRPPYEGWNLINFMQQKFENELLDCTESLFPEEEDRLFPEEEIRRVKN